MNLSSFISSHSKKSFFFRIWSSKYRKTTTIAKELLAHKHDLLKERTFNHWKQKARNLSLKAQKLQKIVTQVIKCRAIGNFELIRFSRTMLETMEL
jgi:hypothetical protein